MHSACAAWSCAHTDWAYHSKQTHCPSICRNVCLTLHCTCDAAARFSQISKLWEGIAPQQRIKHLRALCIRCTCRAARDQMLQSLPRQAWMCTAVSGHSTSRCACASPLKQSPTPASAQRSILPLRTNDQASVCCKVTASVQMVKSTADTMWQSGSAPPTTPFVPPNACRLRRKSTRVAHALACRLRHKSTRVDLRNGSQKCGRCTCHTHMHARLHNGRCTRQMHKSTRL